MKIGAVGLLVGVGLFVISPISALAYSSSYRVGSTWYTNYGSGGTGSSYNLGGTTYYNDSSGLSGSSYRLGGTRYYNYNYPNYSYGAGSITGNSYNLGGTNYYNFNSGYGSSVTGTQYRVGNTDYYSLGNRTTSCYWLGGTYYCN